jgi:fluoroacetyl-CoA thioesterase
LLGHAQAGEDSVGFEILLRHTAPTLPGMHVEITATVSAVEGRKVTFDVADQELTYERLRAKAAKRTVRSK